MALIKKIITKYQFGDHVRLSKYKNIFAKSYVPNWSDEVFVIKKVKTTVSCTCVISDFLGETFVATFYEKQLQKTNHKELKK